VLALTKGLSVALRRLIEELDKAWRIPRLMEKLAIVYNYDLRLRVMRADNDESPKQGLFPNPTTMVPDPSVQL